MQWHHHAIKTLVFTQMAKCPKPTEIRVPNGGVSKGRIKDEKIKRQKQYQEPGGLAQTLFMPSKFIKCNITFTICKGGNCRDQQRAKSDNAG